MATIDGGLVMAEGQPDAVRQAIGAPGETQGSPSKDVMLFVMARFDHSLLTVDGETA